MKGKHKSIPREIFILLPKDKYFARIETRFLLFFEALKKNKFSLRLWVYFFSIFEISNFSYDLFPGQNFFGKGKGDV
jgi:hypothetical protein